MTDSDLWVTASQDTEVDSHERSLIELRMEASQYWPILEGATNERDFNNRFALVEPRLDEITARIADNDSAKYSTLKAQLKDEFTKDFKLADMQNISCPTCGHQVQEDEDTQFRTCPNCGGKVYNKSYQAKRAYMEVDPYWEGLHDGKAGGGMFGEHQSDPMYNKGYIDGTIDAGDKPIHTLITPEIQEYVDSVGHEGSKTAEYHYVKKQGDSWVITQKGTGKVLSHHDSQEKAEAAFRAMMESKHGSKSAAMPDSLYQFDSVPNPELWDTYNKPFPDNSPDRPSGNPPHEFPPDMWTLNPGVDPLSMPGMDFEGSKMQVEAANFTRQHFNHVAEGIRTAPVDEETREILAHHFARHLSTTNANFNPDRFIGAATHRTAAKVAVDGPTTTDPNFLAAPPVGQNNSPAPAEGTPASQAPANSSGGDENLDEAPEPNKLPEGTVVSKRWVDANRSFYEASGEHDDFLQSQQLHEKDWLVRGEFNPPKDTESKGYEEYVDSWTGKNKPFWNEVS